MRFSRVSLRPLAGLPRNPVFRAVIVLMVSATLVGCVFGPRKRSDRSSSVVEFLYPGEINPLAAAQIPVLKLPLKVGIAFVPNNHAPTGPWGEGGLSEMQKSELLKRVADAFRTQEFIASIEVIPTTYLRPRGGFENLDQIKRMLNLDVIALVSYDQVQFTDPNRRSLAYWTIVGAYLFRGNVNDTQTLMEAAVYDIGSRQLLFRAPGAGHVHANATLHQAGEKLRRDSAASLQLATDEMITNLSVQLDDFRKRVKEAPDTVAKIERRAGYGGGSFGGVLVCVLLAICAWAARSKHS
jgi:rhombotail lipoprotein